ncbi:Kef-type potassium/proton antiporter (CPA2 family) [Chromohalobacter marismortui]|uniref:Kef-type potassium/proton antiporter (CPA2 family) n=1 Tax=Chromohalobacter marismortui TaxID=42055 RepID=A0A4R7NSK4_9GAMM|nr:MULTISPECIES: monovalent cation:proton antiporter-2 (CPA2) family protein [Chromohalobacter]MCI0511311.1 monovalent cation:proton antiporter-2 (CPA2) family protein [Chromohalobacter sp.]MCI0594077.1 monovalent cation:proton antiporter-2 (CPA2) family protein [Chromohalobacter sp.]TDU23672.1 Kef-type potassium/proton antiporter (CPA2 family) [Chromohalobacter marismortui]
MNFFYEAAVLLGVSIIAVPLFQRLGLGSILGYLAVGLLLGPSVLGFIAEPEEVLHFSEFGVVMLLFLIGLEMEPARLWGMRKHLFGLGILQLLACGMLLTPIGWALGLSWELAVLLGLILALSSTAFALQLLNEQHRLATPHGQTAFSILLFQDLAVIPLLALLPLFAGDLSGHGGAMWGDIGKAVGMVLAAIVFGRLVFPRVLALIARSGVHEVFTAAALFMVLTMALVMEWAGLSMALGAFLGGVMLADTAYRHELEANIEPFKGILLGLFFIAVGMSVDLALVFDNVWWVLGITLGLLAAKLIVITLVGVVARLPRQEIPRLATVIAQGGEFDFVLLSAAVGAGVFDQRIASLCIAAVTLSMALTPFLYRGGDRLALWMKESRPYDKDFGDETPSVLIAGLGRFGQMVARVLKLQGINFTALDPNIAQVEFIRRFGSRIYYADAARLDVLRSAGLPQAKMLVIAVDDEEAALTIARMVRSHYPQVKIFARARNRHHAWQLMELGVDTVVRETFASSMEMSVEVLKGLGYPGSNALEAVRTFRDFDNQLLASSYEHRHDLETLRKTEHEAIAEFQALFQQELKQRRVKEAGDAASPSGTTSTSVPEER